MPLDGDKAGELAAMAVSRQLSVREVEKLVRQGAAPDRDRARPVRQRDPADDAANDARGALRREWTCSKEAQVLLLGEDFEGGR